MSGFAADPEVVAAAARPLDDAIDALTTALAGFDPGTGSMVGPGRLGGVLDALVSSTVGELSAVRAGITDTAAVLTSVGRTYAEAELAAMDELGRHDPGRNLGGAR